MAARKSEKPHLKFGIIAGLIVGLALISIEAVIISRAEVEPEESVFIEPEPEIVIEPEPPIELPFGGTSVLPDYNFVALYGSPLHEGLGALGEQPLDEAIERAREVAALYEKHTTKTVIPTLEIITTIAAEEPTDNNDYSRETDVTTIQPWVDAAKTEGLYVVLDLQPGRSTFLEQVKQYESLLMEPHVGIALDPEWRLLEPDDRHLVKVGSVTAAEVNETADWLAELVKTNKLPQKIFMVHQFKPSMIQNREDLRTDQPELGYIIHMDGHGTLGNKQETYRRITQDQPLPKGAFTGWKNFYEEDKPTPTPKQTMAQSPVPVFVSYQ